MANPTTNYSFVLPTSSDLVTDLPADFDVALQGVDTRLKALQPGTTAGDLAYSSATANTNVRLGIGSNGQVLAVSGGVPAWTTTADVTPLTTKGDLFTFSTVDDRLPVGTNGQVLTADSSEATGLKYATPASGDANWTLLNSGGTALTASNVITISGISNIENIFIVVRSASSANANAQFKIRINADTGNNYTFGGPKLGAGSTYNVNNFEYSAQTNGGPFLLGIIGNAAGSDLNGFAVISGGKNTGIKTFQSSSGSYDGTGGQVLMTIGGVYNGSAAITSVAIASSTGNFDAGTIFVYGA